MMMSTNNILDMLINQMVDQKTGRVKFLKCGMM